MKTSTKIFLVLAGAAVLSLIGFAINSSVKYKRIKPMAEEFVAQLDQAVIRVVSLDAGETMPPEWQIEYMFSRRDRIHSWNVGMETLQASRISNDTLYMKILDSEFRELPTFSGPDLETVIVHAAGEPDLVVNIPVKEEGGIE